MRSVALLAFVLIAACTAAVDVFVVPELAVSGLSPRIPGPATQNPLRAVVVKSTQRPSDLGRVIAHGVAHYLGLHHLELYTDDNRAIQDPIPDTTPGQNNLMSGGTILTEGQIDVLRRSPVLEPSSSSHRSDSGAASTQDLAYSHDDGNQAYELCRFECDDETAGCCVFAHLGSVHPHHG